MYAVCMYVLIQKNEFSQHNKVFQRIKIKQNLTQRFKIAVFGKQLVVRFRRKFDILLQYIYNYTVTGNMDKVNAWKNENYVVD